MSVNYNSVIAAGWKIEANKAILYPDLENAFIFEADGSEWMVAGVEILRNDNEASIIEIDTVKLDIPQIERLAAIGRAFGYSYETAKLYLINQIC